MTELTINLGEAQERGYGLAADAKARHALAKRAVYLRENRRTARVVSPVSGNRYSLILTWIEGEEGPELAGIMCDCEHGKNNARAWCWHALAVEKQLARYGTAGLSPRPRPA